MDLNHLLYRHQEFLMRADAATTSEARDALGATASCYAAEIQSVSRDLGAGDLVRSAA